MTSELRPAVAVAEDCHWEYEFKSEEEAAAVIEADREAVRAEQAAELAKWKALAETLAGALEEALIERFLRSDSAELFRCKHCGGEGFDIDLIEHRPMCPGDLPRQYKEATQ